MIALNKRLRKKSRRRKTKRSRQSLRFTPSAWAKLLFMRDAGPTEVGMFGITSMDDLLLIEDVAVLRQRCTAVTTAMEDDAVADFVDEQVDLGRSPQQCVRHWLHTHPGNCPLPSMTDEETFADAFDGPDWASMFILARGGRTYSHLKFNVGPGGSKRLRVEVDYDAPFEESDHDLWQAEYEAAVTVVDPFREHTAAAFLQHRETVPGNNDPIDEFARWHASEWVAS